MQPEFDDGAPLRLAGIDTALGLNYAGGDRAFYIRLLERFWRTQRETAGAWREDAAASDWLALAQRAHTLRGSSASVGANGLRDAAAALELAIGQGEAAPDELAKLFPALEEITRGLDEFFSVRHDPCQISSLNPVEALAARAQLIVLLDDFSGETLDYFEEVRASLAQLLPAQSMLALARHLERYEFQAAKAVLEGVLPQSG